MTEAAKRGRKGQWGLIHNNGTQKGWKENSIVSFLHTVEVFFFPTKTTNKNNNNRKLSNFCPGFMCSTFNIFPTFIYLLMFPSLLFTNCQ